MTPASKGAQVKRVPASRSGSAASSRTGNKSRSSKVAATATKRPALTKKKAAPVVKKAAPATKKVASPAKKTAPSAAKKAVGAAAKKAAPAKKATRGGAEDGAGGQEGGACAEEGGRRGDGGGQEDGREAGGQGAGQEGDGQAAAAAAAAPARTTFTPKPKPPAPVRPKTGPYAKDAKFLEEVRELLVADRAIYQEQATSLRAEADSLALEREPGDVQFDEESGEGGTVTVDRERNLALSGQATLAVEEIDEAMGRIDDKTYGYCERCFQPIPKPRLRALPYARLCVACKSGGLSRR